MRPTPLPILQMPKGFSARKPTLATSDIFHWGWSNDGNTLAVAPNADSLVLWNITSNKTRNYSLRNGPAKVAWSPVGDCLAFSTDTKVWCIKPGHGRKQLNLGKRRDPISHLTWSPDGSKLAVGNVAGDIIVYHWDNGDARSLPLPYFRDVDEFIWDKDNRSLLVSSIGGRVERWDTETLDVIGSSPDEISASCFLWTPDNKLLAGDTHGAIHVLDPQSLETDLLLEGHANWITSLSISFDGRLLASISSDGSAALWRCDQWSKIRDLPGDQRREQSYAFHPTSPLMASVSLGAKSEISLWDVDATPLLSTPTPISTQYTSAKVVLIGDSRAGKTCLASALRGQDFKDTETTHGMEIWNLPAKHFGLGPDVPRKKREVVLWDLGGQDWYQLVHQLFLPETTVVVLVLDPTRQRISQENILEWDRRITAQCSRNVTKLLVGTKCDNPLFPFAIDDINEFASSLGYQPIILTSALTKSGIPELRQAIGRAIDWDALTPVGRPEEFTAAREYLLEQREQGEVVLEWSQLTERAGWTSGNEKAYNAMIRALQRQGIVVDVDMGAGRRILILQQEVVSRLAGSVIVAARDDQRECGSVNEDRVRRGDVPSAEVLPDPMNPAQRIPLPEPIVGDVMAAVIQLLLHRELAFRYAGLLWFPALFKLSPEPLDESAFSTLMHIEFDGAIENLYSQLVVQLSRTGAFARTGLWERQARFEHKDTGAVCGLSLKESRNARGLLGLFFSRACPDWVRALFSQYVRDHLEQRCMHVYVTVALSCRECGQVFDQKLVADLIQEGFPTITCGRNHHTQLGEYARIAEKAAPVTELRLMRQDIKLAREVESTTPSSPAVILYTSEDRSEVECLRSWLKDNCGISADVYQIFGAKSVKPLLNGILPQGASVLYCIGKTTDLPEPDVISVFKRLNRPMAGVLLPSADRRLAGRRSTERPDITFWDYTNDPAPWELVRVWKGFTNSEEQQAVQTPIRILHLSDLHFTGQTNWQTMLQPLTLDLQQNLNIDRLDYVVISGDITHRGERSGYAPAVEFTRALIDRFDVPLDRLIIVPGNHDVDRTADVIDTKFSWQVKEKDIQHRIYDKLESNGAIIYAIRKEELYYQRFRDFSELYVRPVLGRSYWSDPMEQSESILNPHDGLAFLWLNSCWEIDGLHPERYSIHHDAVTDAIERLTRHKQIAGWKASQNPLVITVFHHPLSGPQAIKQTDFLQRLAQVGTHICLTGHVHEPLEAVFYSKQPPGIEAIAAGSFGAVSADRPPNTPNQYNVVEIRRDLTSARVYTRARPKEGGTWEGLFKWGSNPNRRDAYYDVVLRSH